MLVSSKKSKDIFKKTLFGSVLLSFLFYLMVPSIILAQDPAPFYPTPDGNNINNTEPDIGGFNWNVIQGNNTNTNPNGYNLLAPIPTDDGGYLETFDTSKECALGEYLNIMITLVIGIAAVLAMVMIVMGGIQYMTSELISGKEAGKERIKNALLGLLLALGSYLILNTINPDLLNVCLDKIPKVQLEILEGDENTGTFTAISNDLLEGRGVYCPGSGGSAELVKIASSFNKKVTYSQEKRGTMTNETIYLDCSSFVKQVYACAGLSLSGYNTKTMFPGTESLNGKAPANIKAGDLLGWMKGESKAHPNAGHIFMAISPEYFIEVSSGGKGVNNAVRVPMPINHYEGSIKHIIRAQ